MLWRGTLLGMDTIWYPPRMDRTGWGDGPWMKEPDKIQWQDLATGLPCLIHRNPMGSLCGYVGVSAGHPWFGVQYGGLWEDDYDSTPEGIIEVHGGLTFSDFCQPYDDEREGICHTPGPGEPAHVWWFGFDCGHAFDLSPGLAARTRELDRRMMAEGHPGMLAAMPALKAIMDDPNGPFRDVYRDVHYVQAEVRSLAAQLHKLAPRPLPA